MSNPLPSQLALTTINDSSLITAAPHRNNYAAIQAAVNALIVAAGGGSAGQLLTAVDGTDVAWSSTVSALTTFTGGLTTGPTAVNAFGTNGIILGPGDNFMSAIRSTSAGAVIAAGANGDTSYRLTVNAAGAFQWGPGNAALDTLLGRDPGGNKLNLGSTTVRTWVEAFQGAAGQAAYGARVTTDTNTRWFVQGDGGQNWGPGNAGVDTALTRAAGGVLNASAKVTEGFTATGSITVPATWTPTLSNGLHQRATITAGGTNTLTIAATGNAPSSAQSSFLVLQIQNNGGGTVTLSWNAQYTATSVNLPVSLASGANIFCVFCWDGALSKWVCFSKG